MQRVRVGLTGLAFVFLLVMLATAFLRGGDERAGGNGAAPAEPLAELGVAPGNSPGKAAAPAPSPVHKAR